MSETFYISKYALAKGKITTAAANVKRWADESEWIYLSWSESFRVGRHAHRTAEAALAAAEAERTKKIASLRKQIAKLEALTFSVSDKEA